MTGSESGEGRKRRWRSVEERRAIVAETLEPGASVARVAQAHGVNANLVFKWRRQEGLGRVAAPSGGVDLLPVTLQPSAGGPPAAVAAIGAAPVEAGEAASDGVIHIQLGKARLRIEGRADASTLQVVLRALRG